MTFLNYDGPNFTGGRMKKLVIAFALTATFAAAQSLPAGTGMKMKLETQISTIATKPGSTFHGRITEPVKVNGRTLIPVGAGVQGRVVKLSEPRRVAGTPEIVLRPDHITMPNGDEYYIAASVVDTDKASGTTVDDEGNIHGPGRSGRDNIEMLGGAGGGTVLGAMAGGAKGALIGGIIGGTVTAGHWLTKRHSATLPAGSEITLELSRPMSMTTAAGGE
jgi:hypothetical protein